MEEWLKNTWIGVLLSSPTTRHEDLYKDGNNKPPKGKYPPRYALPQNRESLKMVCFSSFENAFFLVYQRVLLLFHLNAEGDVSGDEDSKRKGVDKEESEIAADYKAGQMEKKTGEEDFVEYYLDHNSENDIDGEDIVLTDEERRERVEERNISTDSCIDDIFAEIDSSVRKVVLSSHSPPSSPGRYEASAGEKSTAEHSQGEEKDEEEAPLSPASFRKRKPGKLLMLSTHGTANLEKQTQQTIYYVTGAGLHEALALMKTIRPKGVQLTSDEVASRDAMLRANMSFVTAGNFACTPCHSLSLSYT
jgi:hypothetical protein